MDAGAGEQSLMAAERVGLDGLVLATEISAAMLLLSETARDLGVTTIQSQGVDSGDVEVEPDSFDAAVSRNALMLLADRDIARLAPTRCRPGVDPHRLGR